MCYNINYIKGELCMKNLGFTLAEVLITLGIIGVVAALTTPTLVQNVGTSKVGPSIMKALSTWNIANENLLSDQEGSNLKSLGIKSGTEDNYIDTLSHYMKISPFVNNDYTVTTYNGTTLANQYTIAISDTTRGAGALGASTEAYERKKIQPLAAIEHMALSDDGFLYCINISDDNYEEYKSEYIRATGELKETTSTITPNLPYHKFMYGTVLIDINGITKPNKLGKDVFAFQLNADGSLSPWGNNGYWNTNGLDMCNETSAGSGITCGASVLENSRKVIY